MPSDAPALKLAATRGYGAEVVLYDRLTEDREAIARRLADERGLTLVPPYDHPLIIAGQGTAALELIEEVGALDWLLMPVGGGGLLRAAWSPRRVSPDIKVVGVETRRPTTGSRACAAGARGSDPPETIADGIRTQQPGSLTFPIVQALGHGRGLLQRRSVRHVHDHLKFALVVERQHLHFHELHVDQRALIREQYGNHAQESPAARGTRQQRAHEPPVQR